MAGNEGAGIRSASRNDRHQRGPPALVVPAIEGRGASGGLESDADRPNAYHYRDFVIRAFNEDLSYKEFVRWQLAGDEYDPDNPQAVAATGFLTGAPTEVLTVPMEEEKLRFRFNELDDMATTTISAFLGLTLPSSRHAP